MTDTAFLEHRTDSLAHQALFYRDDAEYVDGMLGFIGPGLDAGEPVAVAVPKSRAALLRDQLGQVSPDIEMLDMLELGRNPARIIPAVYAMLGRHGGRTLHYVGEPIWPGRSPAEIREATRHEALINLAWPGAAIRVLCPYDARALDDLVLADAERTHPWLVRDGEMLPSLAYTGPRVPYGCDEPLSEPPPEAVALTFELEDLGAMRALVATHARAAGLLEDRVSDLVLAVNELATNTIKHTGGAGLLSLWSLPEELVCQLEDAGYIADPLAGRHLPAAGLGGGLGLWMVNQLCDLVEVRTTTVGTTIRLSTRLS
jgi:anti-sigma regulatory factor (Ser/Thr protein kinase)